MRPAVLGDKSLRARAEAGEFAALGEAGEFLGQRAVAVGGGHGVVDEPEQAEQAALPERPLVFLVAELGQQVIGGDGVFDEEHAPGAGGTAAAAREHRGEPGPAVG